MLRAAGAFIAPYADRERAPHEGALIIALIGDLGAGKTTFTQGIAEALDVHDPLPSPTFIIERAYKLAHPHFSHLVHIDAYRLESSEELRRLGWENLSTDPRTIIVIEWADKVRDVLPPDVVTVHLSMISPDVHEVTY